MFFPQLEGSPIVVAQNDKFDGKHSFLAMLWYLITCGSHYCLHLKVLIA